MTLNNVWPLEGRNTSNGNLKTHTGETGAHSSEPLLETDQTPKQITSYLMLF